jgi:glucose-6-phosphate isomerase
VSIPALRLRPAWEALEKHYHSIKDIPIGRLFAEDRERGERLAVEVAGIYLDYSKNRITDETLRLLLQLARESGLREHIDAMFRGDKINVSRKTAPSFTSPCAHRGALPLFTTAKMSYLKFTPFWTRWRISPIACAAAPGRATPASVSGM